MLYYFFSYHWTVNTTVELKEIVWVVSILEHKETSYIIKIGTTHAHLRWAIAHLQLKTAHLGCSLSHLQKSKK